MWLVISGITQNLYKGGDGQERKLVVSAVRCVSKVKKFMEEQDAFKMVCFI